MSGEIAGLAHVDTAGQCEGEERLADEMPRREYDDERLVGRWVG